MALATRGAGRGEVTMVLLSNSSSITRSKISPPLLSLTQHNNVSVNESECEGECQYQCGVCDCECECVDECA